MKAARSRRLLLMKVKWRKAARSRRLLLIKIERMKAARSGSLTTHKGTPAEQHQVQEAAEESELTELDHMQKTARWRRLTHSSGAV